jgi:homoserine O-acetyltransferase
MAGTDLRAGDVVGRRLVLEEPFESEGGAVLPKLELAYTAHGDPGGDAVLVIHALTGHADAAGPAGWWRGLFDDGRRLAGPGRFVLCANLLGSCYGSSGPRTEGPDGRPWGGRFPDVTTRDQANALVRLLDHLGIERVRLAIGGSLGAMVLWQLLVDHPERVEQAVPIAGSAQASAWLIGLNHAARAAIKADPEWRGGECEGTAPAAGLGVARRIAMLSYRHHRQLGVRFGAAEDPRGATDFAVNGWLDHHARTFAARFDAHAYLRLIGAMDTHDVARGHGTLECALRRIRARVTVGGIDTDGLYPAEGLRETVQRLRFTGVEAEYREITSAYGHDAFLVEIDQVEAMLPGRVREAVCAF